MSNYTQHNMTHNEGCEGYNPHEQIMLDEARAQAQARMEYVIRNFAAMRKAWNDAVAKISANGQVKTADLPNIEAAAGVTLAEIKQAKLIVEG